MKIMLYNFSFVQHNTTIYLFINVRNLARKDENANEHDKKKKKSKFNIVIQEPAPVQQPQGAEGGAQNLRQGMVVLMDAMRDLLNNIRPAEHPFENPQNEGENNENDEEAQNEEWD